MVETRLLDFQKVCCFVFSGHVQQVFGMLACSTFFQKYSLHIFVYNLTLVFNQTQFVIKQNFSSIVCKFFSLTPLRFTSLLTSCLGMVHTLFDMNFVNIEKICIELKHRFSWSNIGGEFASKRRQLWSEPVNMVQLVAPYNIISKRDIFDDFYSFFIFRVQF